MIEVPGYTLMTFLEFVRNALERTDFVVDEGHSMT